MAESGNTTSSIPRKLLTVLFMFYGVLFIYYFLRSALSFPSVDFLPLFLWDWVFRNALLGFVEAFPPVTLTGCVVFFSLVFVYGKQDANGRLPDFFHSIATSSIVILVILTFVYAVLAEGVAPGLLSAIESKQYQTVLARGFLEKAEALKEEGDYSGAREAVTRYLRIDPKNEVYQKMSRDLLKLQSDAALEREREAAEPEEKRERITGMNSEELTRRAEDAFNTEDYTTAHYYANLAIAVDPDNREAKAISIRALERIDRAGLSREEEMRSGLFRRKREAYDALQRGDVIDAFYLFSDLKDEFPEDPDIEKYLGLVAMKLEGISFFREEVEEILHLPGSRDVLFVNDKTESETELVYIGKVLNLDAGTYLFDIEVIRFDLRFRPVYHFTSPYGKVIDEMINMHCVDRENPENNVTPEYISGSRTEELHNVLNLNVAPDRLESLSVLQEGYEHMSILQMWSQGELKERHGFVREPYQIEFMMRIIRIFSFFVLSLFAVSFGWALRPPGRPPVLVLVFIPLFPFVIYYIVTLYLYANRLLVSFLYFSTGLIPAVAITIALQLLLVIAALVFLAGQTTKK